MSRARALALIDRLRVQVAQVSAATRGEGARSVRKTYRCQYDAPLIKGRPGLRGAFQLSSGFPIEFPDTPLMQPVISRSAAVRAMDPEDCAARKLNGRTVGRASGQRDGFVARLAVPGVVILALFHLAGPHYFPELWRPQLRRPSNRGPRCFGNAGRLTLFI
jgi:hypothetical protein